MPAKKYHCTNFAACEKALSKEVIEIVEGGEVECELAECRKYLVEIKDRGQLPNVAKKAGLAAAVVFVVGSLGYYLWPSSPSPEAAEAMLTEYFPNLPPN